MRTASDAARSLPRFIGISPALIRAVAEMPRDPQRRPATRVEADQMIQEKIKRLQAALKAADSARVAATAKAKTAAKNFDAANDQLNAARSDIEPVRAAVKAAEKKQQDAINAFEDYMSGQLHARRPNRHPRQTTNRTTPGIGKPNSKLPC